MARLRDQLRQARKSEDFMTGAYSNAVGSFFGGLALLVLVGLVTLVERLASSLTLFAVGLGSSGGVWLVIMIYASYFAPDGEEVGERGMQLIMRLLLGVGFLFMSAALLSAVLNP